MHELSVFPPKKSKNHIFSLSIITLKLSLQTKIYLRD